MIRTIITYDDVFRANRSLENSVLSGASSFFFPLVEVREQKL